MMRASDVSPRMFESDFLDFFSRTPWFVVPLVWLPLCTALVAYAASLGVSVVTIAGSFVAGFVIWSLTEYWLHRTAFHWEPPGPWGERFHFLVHGVHHTWHKDPYRLVMPPAVSLVLGATFFGIFWAIAQGLAAVAAVPAGWHLTAFSGFAVGYVYYDCMHYALHHLKPRGTWMKRLRAHHMNHHHNNPDAKFGVSSMVWDRVFGTQG